MFFGETSINLDEKGRLAIPTRYRETIADMCDNQLVLAYNPYDGFSLWLYPFGEWQRVQGEVMALSTFNASHRWLQRQLVGAATKLKLDSHGRILLPTTHRKTTKIDKVVVLMGLGSKFEIWNEEALVNNRDQQVIENMNNAPSQQMSELRL